MPADVKFGNEKIIDVKVAKPRRKKKIILYLILLTVLLWLGLILASADKYYYHYYLKQPPASQKAATLSPPSSAAAPIAPQVQEPMVKNETAQQPALLAPPAAEDMKPAIKAVEKRLDNLEAANNNLLVYFAARDLKDSLDDPDNFKEQLEFLKKAIGADLNVGGKIDILEQATSNGLVTRAKLMTDLKMLQKNLDQSANHGFSGSIKSALGNLVKVTKTEGEVNSGDYDSIIKRAEIVLGRQKISGNELKVVIDDIKKLGKPAEDFVKEANNLERVLEVTDFLVMYTKSKTLENNA